MTDPNQTAQIAIGDRVQYSERGRDYLRKGHRTGRAVRVFSDGSVKVSWNGLSPASARTYHPDFVEAVTDGER